ncbi:hypothetical protein HOR11_gp045 [Lactobacillus phage SA-C12]|uniref:Uncharacterized protein n=1 Tax=Lactobacillus phage SA-C12 TaxID=1755697 RepID=A0A1I9KK73_9CAUD|nr:hypothetical protein HOR11_gp045 [Lactobacillus phage SA-C12]ALY06866.1 hypothetical protein SAC12_045 [Lactobacillus phage SA-C12]
MTREQLEARLLDDGIELADNLGEAIYMFENGVLVSGEFCDGIRGADHNTLLGELPNSDTYEELHQHYAVARLVPETQTALVSGLQLSGNKLDMLKDCGYTIETY